MMKKHVIDQLLEDSRRILNTQPELARERASEALRLSEDFKYHEGRYESLFIMGRIANMFNACQDANNYFEQCIQLADRLNDVKRKVLALNASGVTYDNMLIHSKSLEYFLDALELAKAHQIIELESRILNNISAIFSDLKDYNTALEYLLLSVSKAVKDIEHIGIYYRNIANIYLDQGDYQKAYDYCILARNAVWRERDQEQHGDVYFLMAAVYHKRGRFRRAFRYFQLGFELTERNHCFYPHAEGAKDLAKIFYEQKSYESALTYIQKALAICHQYEYHSLQQQVYKLYADVCHATGDAQHEIEALRKYTETTGMLEEREIEKKRVYAQMQLSLFNMKKEHDKLKDQVQKDPMTGCLSYRHFEAAVKKEIESLKGSAALFFLDVDNLKYINDKYGHEAGDQLIIEFSKTVRETLKERGMVFRKGGDEFLVFLPFAREQELYSFLEELFSKLSKARIIGKTLTPISCSVGIAITPKDSNAPRELENLADKAMYCAKKMGKRCYCFYEASAIK